MPPSPDKERKIETPPAPASTTVGSRTVVVIARSDNSFFDRCLNLLFRLAEASDLTLLCQPVSAARALSLSPYLSARRPLGFLLFSYHYLGATARELQNAGCRVVVVGAPPVDETPAVPTVYSDHEEGGTWPSAI